MLLCRRLGLLCVYSMLAAFAAGVFFAGVKQDGGMIAPAYAQEKTAPVTAAGGEENAGRLPISVVDVERLMMESKAALSIQKQLNAKRESFQKDFDAREKALRAQEQEILKQRAELSPEEFEDKRKSFEQQLLETRKLFQQRRNALDKALAGAMNTLKKEIIKSSAAIAQKRGDSIILTRQNVVIAEKGMDITDLVMDTLNGAADDIKISIDE